MKSEEKSLAFNDERGAACLICGETLSQTENVTGMQCLFCGEEYYTRAVCENGHYVCDGCRSERAYEMIQAGAMKTKQKDVMAIAYELMLNKWVPMHGVEHHFLVTAALLAAYNNMGYGSETTGWDLAAMLEEAKARSVKIDAGYCGSWGCCGAAMSLGVFASLLLKATPLSVAERGTANLMVSRALEKIAQWGGPRCCKRESFGAILTAAQFSAEKWEMPLTEFQSLECHFYHRNSECIYDRCPFFPRQEEKE